MPRLLNASLCQTTARQARSTSPASASALFSPAATLISTRCRGSKSEVTDQRSAIRSLQPDLAHRFGGEDFANVEAFRGHVAAFVGWPDDLVDDRLGSFAQFVERGRVRILDHDDDIEVAVTGGVT